MTQRDIAAVEIARAWIGTPYRHQASCQASGCDCLGMIRGVWRGLYGAEPEEPPPYSMDWNEAQREEALWRAAQRHLRRAEGISPGRVLLFRMRETAVAKHLGIVAGDYPNPSFVHAYSRIGVVESPLSSPWLRRVVAVFEFP